MEKHTTTSIVVVKLATAIHCVQELYADQYFGNVTCSFKLRLRKFRSS